MCAGIAAFRDASSWYLGLYAHFKAFAHQWLDGSLLIFRTFFTSEPNTEDFQCAVFMRDSAGYQVWYDSSCSSLSSFICERPAGQWCLIFLEIQACRQSCLVVVVVELSLLLLLVLLICIFYYEY